MIVVCTLALEDIRHLHLISSTVNSCGEEEVFTQEPAARQQPATMQVRPLALMHGLVMSNTSDNISMEEHPNRDGKLKRTFNIE